MICPFSPTSACDRAMAELSDVAVDLAGSDPALLITTRASARVVAGSSPVMRAGPLWLPSGLDVAPGARRPADWGGAQPGHHERLRRPYRQPPRHKLVPAWPGPLRGGCSA